MIQMVILITAILAVCLLIYLLYQQYSGIYFYAS